MEAASKGFVKTVELLISNGAEVNAEVGPRLAVDCQPTRLLAGQCSTAHRRLATYASKFTCFVVVSGLHTRQSTVLHSVFLCSHAE